jgi:hypothetical protein
MDNPDKLATYDTQDEDKQTKNITQYVLETTNSVNKTCAILQTTGRKDEPNIVFFR